MTSQLQAQIELLERKVEPFSSRSNAVGEAITAIRDTIILMVKGEFVEETLPASEIVEPVVLESEIVEPEVPEAETKKTRKAS
jgi:hypothetical protein